MTDARMPRIFHNEYIRGAQFSSVQFSSFTQSCPTLCNLMNRSAPGPPVYHQLWSSLRLTSIESVMPPTISSFVVSFPSCLQFFPASGSFQMSQFFTLVGQILEFQLQHQSFQGIFRTDFFTIDRFDLLAVQGTLKSLLQHQISKASILRHSAFFIVKLSHPYLTTGKTIALTRQTFAGKVMSLHFTV